MQAAHGLTNTHHILTEHFRQHVFPFILVLAAEGHTERALAFLRAEVNDIRRGLKALTLG